MTCFHLMYSHPIHVHVSPQNKPKQNKTNPLKNLVTLQHPRFFSLFHSQQYCVAKATRKHPTNLFFINATVFELSSLSFCSVYVTYRGCLSLALFLACFLVCYSQRHICCFCLWVAAFVFVDFFIIFIAIITKLVIITSHNHHQLH